MPKPATEAKPAKSAEIPPGEHYTVKTPGLAILLSCSEKHVQNLDASGRLPQPIRLGKAKLWPTDEIRHWLAAGAPPRERWEHLKNANK